MGGGEQRLLPGMGIPGRRGGTYRPAVTPSTWLRRCRRETEAEPGVALAEILELYKEKLRRLSHAGVDPARGHGHGHGHRHGHGHGHGIDMDVETGMEMDTDMGMA